MINFIKDDREEHGVAPICRVLQIVPSTFYERPAIERDPDQTSDRAKRDAHLSKEMVECGHRTGLSTLLVSFGMQ
ncbi:hypothetical protein [Epibacterium ulvae]|uniref:hypothetical protein n=1 Tax=Epibacterium ulvae TaxID=1156985 RepID=UPI0024925AFB|nr:hypothetical protein [Epibacterium ulvae]